MEDYTRALKAGKKMGAKAVRVVGKGWTITIPLDDASADKLAALTPLTAANTASSPPETVGEPPLAKSIRAATIEVIRDGAWNNKMPWKTLAVELVKRGAGAHHWTTLRWALAFPPVITGRMEDLPKASPPENKPKLHW